MKKVLENIGMMMVIFFLVASIIPASFATEDGHDYDERVDMTIVEASVGDFDHDGQCDGLRVYFKNEGRERLRFTDDGFQSSIVINNMHSLGYVGTYDEDTAGDIDRIEPGHKFYDTIPYEELLDRGFESGQYNRVFVEVDTRDDLDESIESNNERVFEVLDECTNLDYPEVNEEDDKPENEGFVKEKAECPTSGVLNLHDRKELLVETDDRIRSVFLKFWSKPGIVYVNGDRFKLEHGEPEDESLGHGMKIYLKVDENAVRYEIECEQENEHEDEHENKPADANICTAAHSLFTNEDHEFVLGNSEVKVEVLEIDDQVAVFRVNGDLLDLQVGEGDDFDGGMIWLKGVGKKPNGLYAVFLLECNDGHEKKDWQDESQDENKPEPEENPNQPPHKDELCEDGCKKEDMCLGIGLRLISNEAPVYCDLDGELKKQKGDAVACQNNYECTSNTCQSGACVDLQAQLKKQTSMLERILKWFEQIFG